MPAAPSGLDDHLLLHMFIACPGVWMMLWSLSSPACYSDGLDPPQRMPSALLDPAGSAGSESRPRDHCRRRLQGACSATWALAGHCVEMILWCWTLQRPHQPLLMAAMAVIVHSQYGFNTTAVNLWTDKPASSSAPAFDSIRASRLPASCRRFLPPACLCEMWEASSQVYRAPHAGHLPAGMHSGCFTRTYNFIGAHIEALQL